MKANNKYTFWVLLFCMISGFTYSQKNSFVPGYVITVENDTLTGVLKKLAPDQANGRVIFRNTYGVKTTYYTKDLLSYKMGDALYVSNKVQKNSSLIGGPNGFMQVMDTGVVNLYFYCFDVNSETSYQNYFDPREVDYYLDDMELALDGENAYDRSTYNSEYFIAEPYEGDFYLERKGHMNQLVKTSGFKKQMMVYFADDPLLVEALKKKKLKYKDLVFMVQVYNRR
jgi:hypothetical protein